MEHTDRDQELRQLLERLEESNRQQAKYAKWQCVFTVAAAICCVGLFGLVYTLMPQMRELTVQLEAVLANLEIVTEQLAGIDLESMVQNVDALVQSSQAGVEQVMEKVSSMDFETLNKAIADLADVVEPLAKFFNVFH